MNPSPRPAFPPGVDAPVIPATRAPLSRRVAWIATACAATAALSLLTHVWPEASLPGMRWMLGLALHWQWLYLVVGVLASGAWVALGGRWGWVTGLVPLVCWSAFSPAAPDGPATGASLRVATANLNVGNTRLGALERWLLAPDSADVVVLQEFNDEAARLVSGGAVLARYPHQVRAPAVDPFGIAVLSRLPFVRAEHIEPKDPRQTPRVRVVLGWEGREVRLSAVHPMPPLDARYAAARDATLRGEAVWLADAGGFGVLAGDLNDTPWSTGIRGVAATLKRASGLAPTWPNAGGWLSVLPLDHVLVTDGWQRRASTVGPDLGSDHRPVTVDLTPAR